MQPSSASSPFKRPSGVYNAPPAVVPTPAISGNKPGKNEADSKRNSAEGFVIVNVNNEPSPSAAPTPRSAPALPSAPSQPSQPPSPRNYQGRQITVNPNWDLVKNVAGLGIFTFMFMPWSYSFTLIVLAGAVKVIGDKYFERGVASEAYQFLNLPAFKAVRDISTLAAVILLIMPNSITVPVVVAGILLQKQLLNKKDECCCDCHQRDSVEGNNPLSERNWKYVVYTAESIAGYAAVHTFANAVWASFSPNALFYAAFYALLGRESYAFAKQIEATKLRGADINERSIDKLIYNTLSQPIFNALAQGFQIIQKQFAQNVANGNININIPVARSPNGSVELMNIGSGQNASQG